MRKFLETLNRIGIVEGMTFRAEPDDGVGMIIMPNPSPTRTQYQATPVVRRAVRRASGHWAAKPLHVTW